MSTITNYLNRLTESIDKTRDYDSLWNKLSKDKFSLSIKYNYSEIKDKIEEYKLVIDKITSIIYKPHVLVSTDPIIIRSELSGPLTPANFKDTVSDTKLWKKKRGEMVPEYVHNEENIDTLRNYENAFISMMLDIIEDEVEDIKNYIAFLSDSLESHYERWGANFAYNSYYLEYQGKPIPYKNIFVTNNAPLKKINEHVYKLTHRIKNMKGTQFYKVNKDFKITKTIMPTNVLLHDELYNYCYKYYNLNFLNAVGQDLTGVDALYYNYVWTRFMKYLVDNKMLRKGNDLIFEVYEEDYRVLFTDFTFYRNGFKYVISQDDDRYGFIIEVSKDAKKSVTYFILTSYMYDEDNFKVLSDRMSNALRDYDNVILSTFNNYSHDYDRVMRISLFSSEEDIKTIFDNLFLSFTYIFEADPEIYSLKCPVCGDTEVYEKEGYHACLNCGATFHLFKEDGKGQLWIKSLRRKYQ